MKQPQTPKTKLTPIAILTLLMIGTAASTALTVEYIILPEDEQYTVDQAITINEETGEATLQMEQLPSGNLVGQVDEIQTQTWSVETMVNENITLEIETNMGEFFTDEEIENEDGKGFQLIKDPSINPEIDEADAEFEDKLIDLTDGSTEITIEGDLSTVEDALELKAYFPINYNLEGNSVEEENLIIEFDAQNAQLEN